MPDFRDLVQPVMQFVRTRTGLIFPQSRRSLAEAGIRRAMSAAGIKSVQYYVEQLDAHSELLDELVAELTVGETYFFRDSQQLDLVRQKILPNISHDRGVRAWSAGCSTGEEPYTLAMMLQEAGRDARSTVIGTDINRARLRHAQRGIYRRWSMRGVSESVISRYFSRKDDLFLLPPSIKNLVEFRYLNLATDQYPSPTSGIWGMDLILCRNVCIYFDAEAINAVAHKLLESLNEEGWLILGASDPLLSEYVDCEVVTTDAGLAYRRKRPTSVAVDNIYKFARDTDTEPTFVDLAIPWDTLFDPSISIPLTEHTTETTTTHSSQQTPAEPEPAAANTAETAAIRQIRTLANLGRLEEADIHCIRALEVHRDSVELTYLHAVVLAEGGRYAESAASARRALYLDRNYIVAHLAHGSALRRIGDFAGARRAFANALHLLGRFDVHAVIPGSDGESAERLTAMTRTQLELVEEAAA